MTDGSRSPLRQPDRGYAAADFDQYFGEAATSSLLGEMFHQHFDVAAPAEVQGFCFVPMSGLRRVADLLDHADPGPFLDAACGRGGPGLWLARQAGRPVHGVDISPVAIAQARTLAADLVGEFGASARFPATFKVGRLEDIGTADAAFAATVCIDALHFAVDINTAVAELGRVTRPGGVLIATTWHTDDGPPRLRQNLVTALEENGWSITFAEHEPDWLEAQLELYAAVLKQPSWPDPAVQRVRNEAEAISDALRGARRLLIQATRGHPAGRDHLD